MGKASRSKQQARSGRRYTTRSPFTGEVQTFRVFISDQGLREWERDRVSLAQRGYPDYPPAVDTVHTRAWNFTGPNLPLPRADLASLDTIPESDGVWLAKARGLVFRILVHATVAGNFQVRAIETDELGGGLFRELDFGTVSRLERDRIVAAAQRTNVELGISPFRWVGARAMVDDILEAA